MARKSKERKHELDRIRKAMKAKRTDASRAKRLANKEKREAIHAQMGDVQIVMKDGIPYMNGDKLDLVNGAYKLVPSALPEGAIKTECDYDPDDDIGVQAYNENALPEDEHEGAEELAKHDAEVGRNIDAQIEKERLYAHKQLEDRHKTAKKGMFDVIKGKLRINNEG